MVVQWTQIANLCANMFRPIGGWPKVLDYDDGSHQAQDAIDGNADCAQINRWTAKNNLKSLPPLSRMEGPSLTLSVHSWGSLTLLGFIWGPLAAERRRVGCCIAWWVDHSCPDSFPRGAQTQSPAIFGWWVAPACIKLVAQCVGVHQHTMHQVLLLFLKTENGQTPKVHCRAG